MCHPLLLQHVLHHTVRSTAANECWLFFHATVLWSHRMHITGCSWEARAAGPPDGKACWVFIVCTCSLALMRWFNIQCSCAKTLPVCVYGEYSDWTVIDLVHENVARSLLCSTIVRHRLSAFVCTVGRDLPRAAELYWARTVTGHPMEELLQCAFANT